MPQQSQMSTSVGGHCVLIKVCSAQVAGAAERGKAWIKQSDLLHDRAWALSSLVDEHRQSDGKSCPVKSDMSMQARYGCVPAWVLVWASCEQQPASADSQLPSMLFPASSTSTQSSSSFIPGHHARKTW